MWSVIEKAMEPRRKKRYQSVEDFMKALNGVFPFENNPVVKELAVIPTIPEPIILVKPYQEDVSEETILIGDDIVMESVIETSECVDLGLSVKWCSHNLGASTPESAGMFLGWGKDVTNWNTLQNDVDGTKYDSAFIATNGKWKTPTRKQFKELIDKCRWTWMEYRGVCGYKVTGMSGKSIFLPAAGRMNYLIPYRKNEFGYYWSSSKSHVYNTAHYLYFNKEDVELAYESINVQRSIRPVCDV